MPTDSLATVYSGNTGQSVVDAPTQLSVIEAVKDLLVSVGWAEDGLFASATVSYPLGAPIVPVETPVIPPTVVCCGNTFLSVGQTAFVGYNPYSEAPCTTSACAFFEWGTSAAGTLANLAMAITGDEYVASVQDDGGGAFSLIITAFSPGPLLNLVPVVGDGEWGVGEPFGGGGYSMRSSTTANTGYSCSQYGFDLTSGPTYVELVFGGQPLVFDFNINGVTDAAQYVLDCSASQYVLVANGSILAMFSADVSEDRAPRASVSILCCAPWIPSSFEAVYCVFVAGPRSWRQQASFQSSPITTALNGNANTYSNTGGYPRLLSFFNPSTPLNTPAGPPIAIGAYVMMGASPTDSAYVVGIMADCTILQAAIGDGAIIDSHRTRTLLVDTSQTPVSLTMAVS